MSKEKTDVGRLTAEEYREAFDKFMERYRGEEEIAEIPRVIVEGYFDGLISVVKAVDAGNEDDQLFFRSLFEAGNSKANGPFSGAFLYGVRAGYALCDDFAAAMEVGKLIDIKLKIFDDIVESARNVVLRGGVGEDEWRKYADVEHLAALGNTDRSVAKNRKSYETVLGNAAKAESLLISAGVISEEARFSLLIKPSHST